MAIAVVIYLSEDGQPMVGEIDADMVDPAELEPIQTLEEAFEAAETLILGEEAPPEVEEDAFNAALAAPERDREMED